MKVIMALSGGIDSATVLADLVAKKITVECVGFNYGSKHNPYELKAAADIAKHFGVPYTELDVSQVFAGFESNLLAEGGDIPEGHYEEESMSLTVVPCRNAIFATFLAGLAESRHAQAVALGIHQGDHAIYPDCRPAFYKAMNDAILAATDGKVFLMAPFLHKSKADVVERGLELKAPYELTRTCYKAQELPCGVCGSCTERLEAFELNSIKDPVPYVKLNKKAK